MSRPTKLQLQRENAVLKARAAHISASLRELLYFNGIPEWVYIFLQGIRETDEKYVAQLRDIEK